MPVRPDEPKVPKPNRTACGFRRSRGTTCALDRETIETWGSFRCDVSDSEARVCCFGKLARALYARQQEEDQPLGASDIPAHLAILDRLTEVEEVLEGNEVVKCEECGGKGQAFPMFGVKRIRECTFCLGTGYRLKRKGELKQ